VVAKVERKVARLEREIETIKGGQVQ